MKNFADWTDQDVLLHNSRVRKENRIPVPEDAVEREKGLHADLCIECKRRGWIILRGSMAHKAMRTLGEPDATILAVGGRVFFFEMKSKTGKLSSEQLGLQMVAEKLGHPIHVIRSMSEFYAVVDAPKYCHKCAAWHSPTDAGWQGKCNDSCAVNKIVSEANQMRTANDL